MSARARRPNVVPPRRLWGTVGGLAVFAALYATAFAVTGQHDNVTAWWLTTLPAIAAGWTYGLAAGFWVGMAVLPVDAAILGCLGLPGWDLTTQFPGAFAHAVAPLAGAVCGRLHELGLGLHAERNRRRETERELQLTRRSLDATVRLLNDQATTAHEHWQAKNVAEEEAQRSQRELQRAHIRLTRTALTDIFTELPNRRAALERLHLEWAAARAKNRPLSCLVVRLDEPLKFRAQHGPQISETVLRETLDVLRDSVRQSDELFSLGGDEFMIICPAADLTAAQECAERLRGLVEVNTVSSGNATHHVTISVGVAANEPGLESPAELLYAAQQAVYALQAGSRNQVRCCDAGHHTPKSTSREVILAV